MEAIPDMRMETEDRQSTEYEVHHQKLVNTHKLPSYTSLDSDLTFPRGRVSSLSSLVMSQGCHHGDGCLWRHLDDAPHLLLLELHFVPFASVNIYSGSRRLLFCTNSAFSH